MNSVQVAKRTAMILSQPKGADGPWHLTVVFESEPGLSDPELLAAGLTAVYKSAKALPPVISVVRVGKEATDGHDQAG